MVVGASSRGDEVGPPVRGLPTCIRAASKSAKVRRYRACLTFAGPRRNVCQNTVTKCVTGTRKLCGGGGDEPDPARIDIEDIAHALSMLVRFSGYGVRFYSVAEHSVHVSREIDRELAMIGLLRDAAEAYLGDVPSPLKRQLTQFSAFEHKMELAIGERFGVDASLFTDPELKRADVQLLVDEKAVLMVPEPEPWQAGAPSVKDPGRIEAWAPENAKRKFLARFEELGGI